MKNIITFVGCLFLGISLMAQNTSGSEYDFYNKESEYTYFNSPILLEIQNAINANGIYQEHDKLLIEQIGSDNKIEVHQILEFASSYMNTSSQIGNGNTAYINQTGRSHQTILLQNNTGVLGSEDPIFGNEANLWSEGFNAQNVVVQVGNNNLINQFIENYYAVTRSAVAVQLGNDNKIELALLDRGELNNLMGAMVTQTGDANSAELVLNQSDASYFKINQSGGAEIKVTQTDFYFPMK
jgi:hypothetical protein